MSESVEDNEKGCEKENIIGQIKAFIEDSRDMPEEVYLDEAEDFATCAAYREAVTAVFSEYLAHRGDRDRANRVLEYYGANIDYRSDPAYKEAVERRYLLYLREGDLDEAEEIEQEYGLGIDLHASKDFAASARWGFIKCMRRGYLRKADYIKDRLGSLVDFTELEARLSSQFPHQN